MSVETSGGVFESHTSDGLTVTSSHESAADIKANFESEAKPLDGAPVDPKKEEAERVSKAASELGKKGGKAAAKAREKAGPDPEEVESSPVEEKPLGKPRDDPRARMLEATRKEAEAKRERDVERQRAQRLEAELAQERAARQRPAEGKQEPAKAIGTDEDPKPHEKDFDDYSEFVEARARWAARQEHKTIREKETVRERAHAYASGVQKALDDFHGRIVKAREADAGFNDKLSPEVLDLRPSYVLARGERPDGANAMADEITVSDSAAGLLVYLSEHPEDFQRIATLPSRREIAREIAKIEARLEAVPTGATSSRPVAAFSKAKPPVNPVQGSATSADPDEVSDDLSIEEHIDRMNARDQAARRAGARR